MGAALLHLIGTSAPLVFLFLLITLGWLFKVCLPEPKPSLQIQAPFSCSFQNEYTYLLDTKEDFRVSYLG